MQRMKLQIWWRKKIKTKKRIRGEEFLINIQISYRQTVYHIIYIICPYALQYLELQRVCHVKMFLCFFVFSYNDLQYNPPPLVIVS